LGASFLRAGAAAVTKRTGILVGMAIVLLFLVGVNDRWAVKGDSAYYLSLGRSLAEGRGMEFMGQRHWAVPPVTPVLIAACRLLVGDAFWLINLIMTLFGLGVVALAYLMVREWQAGLPDAVRPGLLLGTLLVVGTSARLYIDATRILTDVPFTLLVTLGVWACVRGRRAHWGWFVLACAAFLAATLTRLVGVLFLLGSLVAVLLESDRRRRRRLLPLTVGVALFVGAGLLVWNVWLRSRMDPGTLDYMSAASPGGFLPTTAQKWQDIGLALARVPSALCGSLVGQKAPYVNLVPTALVACGLWTMLRKRQWVVPLVTFCYVVPLVLYTSGAIAPRYFLPLLPLSAYALLVGVQTLSLRLGRRRAAPEARRPVGSGPTLALRVTVALAMAVSLPKVAREVYWMRHPRFDEVFDGGRWLPYREMAATLRRRGNPQADRALAPKAPVVHYLTGLAADGLVGWQGEMYAHWTELLPGEFVQAAAAGPYRFVIVPTDAGPWSAGVLSAMEDCGVFVPVERRGDLALYERVGDAAGPANRAEGTSSSGIDAAPQPYRFLPMSSRRAEYERGMTFMRSSVSQVLAFVNSKPPIR